LKINRVLTLISNDLIHGPKDAVLIMAVVMPVLLALFFNLAFGNIFTSRAELGIYDEGHSRLSSVVSSNNSLSIKIYNSESSLRSATQKGSVDMGILLPNDFDKNLSSGNVRLTAYIWGESLAKNREVIALALADAAREINGAVLPVKIETVSLGDETGAPWSDRLLPLAVLIAVFFGGLMIPASSLINEKQRGTLVALSVSPATIGEIFIAKGTIGILLATIMGIITLVIGKGFTVSFPALVLVMALGSVMAAEIGLIAGAMIKDINTLYAFWKFGGLLLFGPAFVYMFPQIPSWVGYIFPTYYVIKPVMDLSLNGAGLTSSLVYLTILVAIIFALGVAVNKISGRMSTQALRING
jgi:ABC-2 type transport system permease protein